MICIYNFATSIPEEINWYLANYNKCNQTDASDSNYLFSKNDSNPWIWIPLSRSKFAGKTGTCICITLPPTLLQLILKDYQVHDDVMQEWEPKAGGAIPIPFLYDDKKRVITQTEGKLVDNLTFNRGLPGLQKFKDKHDMAFNVSDAEYPHNGVFPSYVPSDLRSQRMWIGNDGQKDAFRHTYWNALLTREFGLNWTLQYATAHEVMPGNPEAREAMDLYNNEVGRDIATKNKSADEKALTILNK